MSTAATVRPFALAVPQEALDSLRQKLALTRLPDELQEAQWQYGVPLRDIKRLAHHWQHTFDWRLAEAALNATLPQFTTSIQADGFSPLDIHFVHAQSPRKNAIPLLFIHGWPGSIIEVRKLLPLLTSPADDGPAFHVVAPSLPNFGFSEGVADRAFSRTRYVEVLHRLMLRCGYDTYVAQGGDWGMLLSRLLTIQYPQHCVAQHTNMPVAQPPTLFNHPGAYLASLWETYVSGPDAMTKQQTARAAIMAAKGRGYNLQQSTKPQTIGYSQADSPVGLLAWIHEKLHHWSDHYPWTDDEVLTWVSIYWFSRAGPAAASRIYYEINHDGTPPGAFLAYNPGTKYGLARFPRELGGVPRSWLATLGDIVRLTDMPKGGHFAAYEVPEDLAAEIRGMFAKGSRAYGVVPGCDGY